MSRFSEICRLHGSAPLLSQHGESVSYTAPGGEAVSVSAIVPRAVSELGYDVDGENLPHRLEIRVLNADSDGGGILVPIEKGVFVISGESWVVKGVELANQLGRLHRLTLGRFEREQVTGESRRLDRG